MKTKNHLILIFSFLVKFTSAQNEWGQINPAQFDVKTCPIDNSAKAMVLFDTELINFAYEEGHLFVYYKRHNRVQILDKEGFNHASVKLVSYRGEMLVDIKAQTLNKGESGKVNITQVDKKLIFNEAVTKRFSFYKIAFPDVKTGSVIEYEYVTRSRYLRFLKEWDFQSTIPTLKSILTFRCPYFMNYTAVLKSSPPFTSSTSSPATEKWFTSFFGNSRYAEERTDVQCIENAYTLENVPALHEEKYVSCFEDYIARMQLILLAIKFPNELVEKNYAESWEDVISERTKNADFGLLLGGNGVHVKNAKAMVVTLNSNEEKLKAIYNHVNTKMKWNEQFATWPSGSLAKTYTDGIGTSADINMILVDMLRASGIKADPLLIKIYGSGKVQRDFPELDQFNHLIAYAEIDSIKYLLDATDPNLPYNLTDLKDLNSYGLRMNQKQADWIEIKPKANSSTNIVAQVSFTPEGKLLSKTMIQSSDYEALKLRNKFNTQKPDEAIDNVFSIDKSFDLASIEAENKTDLSKKLKVTFDMTSKKSMGLDKTIYLNPFLIKFMDDNPFKLSERSYPINFLYPFNRSIKLSIVIPEGYSVTELPKSSIAKIEDGSVSFSLIAEVVDKYIQINCTLAVKSQEFQPELYPAIKNIFSKAIEAYNTTIVLEKK